MPRKMGGYLEPSLGQLEVQVPRTHAKGGYPSSLRQQVPGTCGAVGLSSSTFGWCEALDGRAGSCLTGIDGFGFLKPTVCNCCCQGPGWRGEAGVVEQGQSLQQGRGISQRLSGRFAMGW